MPPGGAAATTSISDAIGALVSTAQSVSAFAMQHTGNGNVIDAGKTIAYKLSRIAAAGGTTILATITLAADGGTVAGNSSFAAVALVVGDVLTVTGTPSAVLTAAVTDIMASAGGGSASTLVPLTRSINALATTTTNARFYIFDVGPGGASVSIGSLSLRVQNGATLTASNGAYAQWLFEDVASDGTATTLGTVTSQLSGSGGTGDLANGVQVNVNALGGLSLPRTFTAGHALGITVNKVGSVNVPSLSVTAQPQ